MTGLDREGRVVSPATRRGYAGLFVAEGLQAYAHATGDEEALEIAIATLWRSLSFWNDPERFVAEGYIPHNYPGMRILGTHMVLVLTLTQLLEQAHHAAAHLVEVGLVGRGCFEVEVVAQFLGHSALPCRARGGP